MNNPIKAIGGALALIGLLLCAAPAFDADAPPRAELSQIPADPALWTVHGPKGTATLFGSIHILPPNMQWRTARVDAAMKTADIFVFEIPMDDTTKAEVVYFIQKNGTLPPGTTLTSLLNDKARADYAAALALSHMPPENLENKRPWLAMLVLDVGYIMQQHLSPDAGVDRQVYAAAQTLGGKSFRAFETPEQQFRLFMPKNQKLEIAEFDVALKEMRDDKESMGDLIDAWSHGDETKLDRLMRKSVAGHPDVEKALFEDRNRAWTAQSQKMLGEPHNYFITVGAGHLAGPRGVPALLRAKGYKVEGP